MCKHGDTVMMIIGSKPEQPAQIDKCIVQIVQALNHGGVPTVNSCCGHGADVPQIILADGRSVYVMPSSSKWKLIAKVVYNEVKFRLKGVFGTRKDVGKFTT